MRSLRKFEIFNAKSLQEAVSLLTKYKGKAWPIAGGTDLLTILRFQPLPEELYPEVIVNLKTIEPSLEYIKEEGGILKIGALTRLEDIAKNPLIMRYYQALAEACGKVGSPHLREMGTIGGNICQLSRCWYFRKEDNRFYCLRKGPDGKAWALMGDNRFHSIFGSVKLDEGEPCTNGCPNKTDIPSIMAKIKNSDIEDAARKLLDVNPIPSITGRVCPHYCEEKCSRCVLDESVAIRSVERFLGDYILDNVEKFVYSPKVEKRKAIAIVGSGPAGLSAAYYLRKMGYNVTIFEKENKPGGVLLHGIPKFRLPKHIIEKYIEIFKKHLGIDFRLNVTIGKDVTLRELMAKYDAVFLASGAWTEVSMRIPGEELMMPGLAFMKNINSGVVPALGRRVAVIGGGNVAIDVARVLVRMNLEPTIIYRRTEREMPALKEEIKAAKEEGVKFEFLTQPVECHKSGDKVLLKCVKMRLGPPDQTGRPSPVPIEGSEYIVEYDAVIKAIGEAPDLSFVPAEFLNDKGKLKWDPMTYHVEGNLFAGGDVITGPATVVEAINAGRKAAESIDQYLNPDKRISKLYLNEEPKYMKIDASCLKKMCSVIPNSSVAGKLMDMDTNDVVSITEIEKEAHRCLECGCIMAHPSDVAPALIALNAVIVTNKRTISAEKFFRSGGLKTTILDFDEIVVEIQIPRPEVGMKSKFMKFALRSSIDFPIVNCAAAIKTQNSVVQHARICLNAVAPLPYRAVKAEEYIIGKRVTEQTAEEAAAKVIEDANPLPYNTYKVSIAKALIKRTILACA